MADDRSDPSPGRGRSAVEVTPDPDPTVGEDAAEHIIPERSRRSRWGTLLWTALGSLMSLAMGLWVTQLVDELFAYSDWLGWLAAVLAGLAAFAFLAIVVKE